MNKRPVVIDCDPGVDDTLAIFLAASRPELDIRAICPVAGNVSWTSVAAGMSPSSQAVMERTCS